MVASENKTDVVSAFVRSFFKIIVLTLLNNWKNRNKIVEIRKKSRNNDFRLNRFYFSIYCVILKGTTIKAKNIHHVDLYK